MEPIGLHKLDKQCCCSSERAYPHCSCCIEEIAYIGRRWGKPCNVCAVCDQLQRASKGRCAVCSISGCALSNAQGHTYLVSCGVHLQWHTLKAPALRRYSLMDRYALTFLSACIEDNTRLGAMRSKNKQVSSSRRVCASSASCLGKLEHQSHQAHAACETGGLHTRETF